MATTSIRPVSLREWQIMFLVIYQKKDQRHYTPQDLLLHIQEEAALVDEALRKEENEDISNAIAHLFCWFLSFCNMANINLEEVVWDKYQGVCPYCGRERNCICIAEEEKPLVWLKNSSAKAPRSLTDWQEMSERIYGKIDKMIGTLRTWLHVHEELGELSRAFRLGRRQGIEAEAADCLMWLLAFCNCVKVDLDSATFGVYPGECDTCHQKMCQCPKV